MAGNSWHGIAIKKAQRAAMAEVQRRFQRFSIAEYEANKNAARMVQVLVEIAEDHGVDVMVRRLCALDVIERSDGKVAQKVQVRHDMVEEDVSGVTLDHEVRAATAEAWELAEAERWISSGLDPSGWPQEVRDRFGPEALLALAPAAVQRAAGYVEAVEAESVPG